MPPDCQSRCGSHARQLVVVFDHDDTTRTVVLTILRAHGFRVLVAAPGDEALRILARLGWRIDLMIADLGTPVMIGLDYARRLNNVAPDVPVLLMSGDFSKEDSRILAQIVLGRKFVSKPFTQASLLLKVTQALAGISAATLSRS